MNDIKEKAYIFGSVFTLSNKLQVVGDNFDKNITIKQWLLLAGIFKSESDAPTITEIARFIGNSRQNVKKMVLILEKEGFVTIKRDAYDARILRISLTQNCRDYLKQREDKELEFLRELFSGFTSDDINALTYAISKLEKNIIKMEKLYAND